MEQSSQGPIMVICQCLVKSLTSEATPLETQGITKLAILPDYKRPGMLCLASPACRKVRKMDFQSQFSMSKIIRIFLNFFFIEEYKFRCTFFVIGIF